MQTIVRRLSTAASSIRYSAFFLVFPRCRRRTLGPRAFSVAGPSLWNSVPDLERSGSWRGQLQTSAEDAFIYTEAFSVLEMFLADWLTYILTPYL